MNDPLDVTANFVLGALGPLPRRVLDVGAGDGGLAKKLARAGHSVVAIDTSARNVEQAVARGVDARVANWPDFDDSQFDAIIFNRSLHHIHPVDAAVAKAAASLQPGGMLFVEDFAFADASRSTIQWFRQIVRDWSGSGGPIDALKRDEFALKLAHADDPMTAWNHGVDHHIAPASAMRDSIAMHFGDVTETYTPYLYRYMARVLRDDAVNEYLPRILQMELAAAADGMIDLIGRRWVSKRALR